MNLVRIFFATVLVSISTILPIYAATQPLPTLIANPSEAASRMSTGVTQAVSGITTKNSFTNLPTEIDQSALRAELSGLFRAQSAKDVKTFCEAFVNRVRDGVFGSEQRGLSNFLSMRDVSGGVNARCNEWATAADIEERTIVAYAQSKNIAYSRNADNIPPGSGRTLAEVNTAKQRTDTRKAAFLSPSTFLANINAENKKRLEDWKRANCGGENATTNNCQEADRLLASFGTGTAATAARTQAVTDAQKRYDDAQKDFTDSRCPATFTPSTPGASESEPCKSLRAERDAAKTALDNAQAAAVGGAQAETNNQNQGACQGGLANLSFGCFFQSVVDGAKYLLQALLIGMIAGPLLTISGLLFDTVLTISIVNFSNIIGSIGTGTDSAIYATWVLIRNLFNIIILFQLLKIAIQKILGDLVGKQDDLKKRLIAIIIFALLTNFSFFFTKALVDLSNIAALQFYAGMAEPKPEGTNVFQNSISIAMVEGLGIKTGLILDITGAASAENLLGATSEGAVAKDSFQDSFIGILILFLLLLLASFILVQGAAIFMTRMVVLILLIILSPLMFARGIVGFVEKWSDKWWSTLLEQLYVAPLYLAMLFIVLKVGGGGTEYGLLAKLVDPATSGFAGGTVSYFGSIIAMIIQGGIMAGLFIAAVKIAKDFGGVAAQKSSAWGARAYGAAVGGAGGYAMRKSVGRLGASVTTGKWGTSLQNAKQQGGIRGALANSVLTVGTSASNAKFDVRNSSVLKGAEKLSGGRLDISKMGSGASKGFYDEATADADRRKKEREEKAKATTQIRATRNETGDEKSARERANTERLATYGKVAEYEKDESGKIIMVDKIGEDGKVVLDKNNMPVRVPQQKRDAKGNLEFKDDLVTRVTTKTGDIGAALAGTKSQSKINAGVTADAKNKVAEMRKKKIAEDRIKDQEKILEKYAFTTEGGLKTLIEINYALESDIEENEKKIRLLKEKGQKTKIGTIKKKRKVISSIIDPKTNKPTEREEEYEEDVFDYVIADENDKKEVVMLENENRKLLNTKDKAKKWHERQSEGSTWSEKEKKEEKKDEKK
jgi:hypothetical protein